MAIRGTLSPDITSLSDVNLVHQKPLATNASFFIEFAPSGRPHVPKSGLLRAFPTMIQLVGPLIVVYALRTQITLPSLHSHMSLLRSSCSFKKEYVSGSRRKRRWKRRSNNTLIMTRQAPDGVSTRCTSAHCLLTCYTESNKSMPCFYSLLPAVTGEEWVSSHESSNTSHASATNALLKAYIFDSLPQLQWQPL